MPRECTYMYSVGSVGSVGGSHWRVAAGAAISLSNVSRGYFVSGLVRKTTDMATAGLYRASI